MPFSLLSPSSPSDLLKIWAHKIKTTCLARFHYERIHLRKYDSLFFWFNGWTDPTSESLDSHCAVLKKTFVLHWSFLFTVIKIKLRLKLDLTHFNLWSNNQGSSHVTVCELSWWYRTWATVAAVLSTAEATWYNCCMKRIPMGPWWLDIPLNLHLINIYSVLPVELHCPPLKRFCVITCKHSSILKWKTLPAKSAIKASGVWVRVCDQTRIVS